MNDYRSCLPDAIQLVLAFDLPDTLIPGAVQAQARLLAHISPEEPLDPN